MVQTSSRQQAYVWESKHGPSNRANTAVGSGLDKPQTCLDAEVPGNLTIQKAKHRDTEKLPPAQGAKKRLHRRVLEKGKVLASRIRKSSKPIRPAAPPNEHQELSIEEVLHVLEEADENDAVSQTALQPSVVRKREIRLPQSKKVKSRHSSKQLPPPQLPHEWHFDTVQHWAEEQAHKQKPAFVRKLRAATMRRKSTASDWDRTGTWLAVGLAGGLLIAWIAWNLWLVVSFEG